MKKDYGTHTKEVNNAVSKRISKKAIGKACGICLIIVIVGVLMGFLADAYSKGGHFTKFYVCIYLNSTCDDDQAVVENYFNIVDGDDNKRGVYSMYSTDCVRLCCPDWFKKGEQYTCEIENLENTIDGDVQILEVGAWFK